MMTPSKLGVSNGSRNVMMAATKKRKAATKTVKKAGSSAKPGDRLWLPNAERPAWLDGSMAGDRGFDPLGLSRPVEYLQVDLDGLDQNAEKNLKGGIVGDFKVSTDQVSTETLQPYSEVFGIQRFRECELIHGRWCMLATAGCLIQELVTGIPWQNAGQAILESGGNYLGFGLPFSLSTLVWIEVLLVGGAELYRNGELDTTKRCYPGGYFDPLGFAGADQDPVKVARLKEAEIKHCRLAMVAFFGFSAQALATGQGVFGSLAAAVNL